MFLTSCKKQKLKSARMEPKLQQQRVSSRSHGWAGSVGVQAWPVHSAARQIYKEPYFWPGTVHRPRETMVNLDRRRMFVREAQSLFH